MKSILVLGALLFGWLILSQIIAWMISVDKDPDQIVDLWAAVFLAPAMLALIGMAYVSQWHAGLMYCAGFPGAKPPEENPMEYIP